MESTRLWPIKPLSVFHLPNTLYFNILFLISFLSGRLIPRPTPLGMHDIYIGNQTGYLRLQISQSTSRTKPWHSKAHFILRRLLILISDIFYCKVTIRTCLKHLTEETPKRQPSPQFEHFNMEDYWLYSESFANDTLWRKLVSTAYICNVVFFVTTQNLWPQVRVGM